MFKQLAHKKCQLKRSYMAIVGFLVVSAAMPLPSYAWTKNTLRSFHLEVVRNPAIGLKDLRYMAAAILMTNGPLTREEALRKAGTLNAREAKILLSRDFPITYYEIPIDILESKGNFGSDTLVKLEKSHQLFERGGKLYMRWFVHPMHDASYFENNFKEYQGKGRYRALLTSSRSLLIEDKTTGEEWGLKSSLNQAYGPFKNKAYNSAKARQQFEMSRVIHSDSFLRDRFFIEESFISFSNDAFDEGQVVRSLDPFKKGEMIRALATLLDPQIATGLSRKNGYGADWKLFLREEVARDLGVTLGYLFEKYGLVHNSLHSQNVTVRFGGNGKFHGDLVRDPDFDVVIDKFRKATGSQNPETFIASKNARDHSSIILDFSVLNGLFNLRMGETEKYIFYRELGASFITSFLQTVSDLRGSPLSSEEIKRRTFEQIRVDEQGEYGQRLAVCLAGKDIDKLLDPQAQFKAVQYQQQKEFSRADLEHAREVIVNEISFGGSALSRYAPQDLSAAWRKMVDELRETPELSDLGATLHENKPEVIRRLIVMLNRYRFFPATLFMKLILVKYPEVLRTNPISFFFNDRYDEDIMRTFVAQASGDNILRLWQFRNSNHLFEYPDAILARLFVRLDDKAVNGIKQEIMINKDLTRALKDSLMSGNYDRLMGAIARREQTKSQKRGGAACPELIEQLTPGVDG